MRNIFFYITLLPLLVIFSCNSSSQENSESKLTATINGEEWEFYDVNTTWNGEDLEIVGQGYLNGDRGTVPVDLKMTIVALPDPDQIEVPLTAYFAPNTLGTAVFATIIPTDEEVIYDTKLDPNAKGVLVVDEVNGSSVSGAFNFIAADKTGIKLEVSNGKFNNLEL